MMTTKLLNDMRQNEIAKPVVQQRPVRASVPKPNIKPKPRGRSSHSMIWLHSSLIAGSVLATLFGANLLAGADATATTAASADGTGSETNWAVSTETQPALSSGTNSALILAPVPTIHAPTLTQRTPNATAATTIGDTPVQLDLGAVPEVVVPNIAATGATAADGQSSIDLDALFSFDLPAIPDVQQAVQQAAQQASQRSSQSSAPVSRSRSSR